MVAHAMKWRFVAAVIVAHVMIDAGSTFLAWHQSVGPEKWAVMTLSSYEACALYAKLLVGICSTILTLRDDTWSKTKAAA